jgi:hypothetical protein
MDTTSPTAPVYNVVGKESDTREDEPLVDFEPALKGHRFTALRKKSVLRSFLGGAAVYRCDERPIFIAGFSRCGTALFPTGPLPRMATVFTP